MPALQKARKYLLAAVVGLAVLDVALLVLLFSPLTQRAELRQRAYDQAQDDLLRKRREAAPLLGMDAKLKNAQAALDAFYKNRLPASGSVLIAELGKLATQSGVRLSDAKYDQTQSGLEGLDRKAIVINLEGEYVNTVKFINALERDHMFFILTGVTLQEQQGGSIKLQMNLETYLKSATL
jgi:type IV pilus assembly protein PilO